jgi:hypothetical protein
MHFCHKKPKSVLFPLFCIDKTYCELKEHNVVKEVNLVIILLDVR